MQKAPPPPVSRSGGPHSFPGLKIPHVVAAANPPFFACHLLPWFWVSFKFLYVYLVLLLLLLPHPLFLSLSHSCLVNFCSLLNLPHTVTFWEVILDSSLCCVVYSSSVFFSFTAAVQFEWVIHAFISLAFVSLARSYTLCAQGPHFTWSVSPLASSTLFATKCLHVEMMCLGKHYCFFLRYS